MEDSRMATLEHIRNVKKIGLRFVRLLENRLIIHDKSKLKYPEKPILDEFTQSLKGSTYMSPEYNKFLKEMKPGLDHHYSLNDHHPQFFKNGIEGMSLLSISEMLIDWCAAVRRHTDGDIMKSIEINQERYGFNDELKQIFINTVKEIGYE